MRLKDLPLLLIVSFFLNIGSLSSQAPNFTLTDIYGVEHSLYEDYLDQGKTVFISFSATWNIWDSVWVNSGVMQDFQDSYAAAGNAAILLIDPNSPTIQDFQGIGNNSTGYNFVDNTNFPLISTDYSIVDSFGVAFFPSIRMICPDGTTYADQVDSIPNTIGMISDPNLFYGEFTDAEKIAQAMFNNCGATFDLNSVTATVYADQNDNCDLDTDEKGILDVMVEISGANGTISRTTDAQGEVRRLFEEGDYTFSVTPPNDIWETCNSPYDVSFTAGSITHEDIYLGLQAKEECSKLVTTISSPRLRRCFDSTIEVKYCNEGSVSADNSQLFITLGEFLDYQSASITPSSINGQELTFDLGSIDPWECGKIKIIVKPDCDADLGTEQCYQAYITPESNCNVESDIKDEECQEIVGAYDPNDKRAFPLSGSDNYDILPNETIKYQIRFQNTGTDTAFNIVVEDVLSEQLDLSTFRITQASHVYEVEINDARKLIVRFPNIMLPDSNVNLLGSNGYFNYTVDQMPNLPNGTRIENTAAIYFDFNDPIWTNTSNHIVDDQSSSTDEIENIVFSVSPNPASDELNIIVSDAQWNTGTVELYGMDGKRFLKDRITGHQKNINLLGIDNGLYILQLTSDEGEKAKKLISIVK